MGIPQWSNVWDSTLPAEATSSNPGRGTKIPQAMGEAPENTFLYLFIFLHTIILILLYINIPILLYA